MKLMQIKLPGQPEELCRAVGIDFGTTYSLVGHYDDGVRLLADSHGRYMIPSMLDHIDGQPVVGNSGFSSVKRLLGAPKIEDAAKSLGLEHADGKIKIGDIWLSPVEAAAKIFEYLRKDIVERNLGLGFNKAVVTVPAYYDDIARKRTVEAAKLGGFDVMRLISEPTAAAYAYGVDKKCEGVYCVYDLGGGTFDVSALSMKSGCFRVIATKGDLALGGVDIDLAIASKLRCSMREARKIKESGGDFMREFAKPFVDRTISILESVVRKIEKKVDGVILVGGSSRLQLVKSELLARGFNILDDINPDEAVAYGATMRACALYAAYDSLMLDVTPLSLGLGLVNNMVDKLIPSNTPIPISATQIFTTQVDGQEAIEFSVCQGESDSLSENRVIANFTLSGIKPRPAGIPKVKVTFSIDVDGTLKVTAEDDEGGSRQIVEIMPSYGAQD